MLSIDRYTKLLLTIIAASLVWLCVSNGIATSVSAQATATQRVIVAGWADEDGYVHPFPIQRVGNNSSAPAALPVRDDRR
jgi:hypothetical protein